MRTYCCAIFVTLKLTSIIYLTATLDVSAVTVIHEFSGVVSFSNVTGVAVNDPFIVTLTYDTVQPDLAASDVKNGRYVELRRR